jgi:hypothetical protein
MEEFMYGFGRANPAGSQRPRLTIPFIFRACLALIPDLSTLKDFDEQAC